MTIRIASTAYALPPDSVDVRDVISEERSRIETALNPVSEKLKARVIENLGVERVRACREMQPYALAREAASQAMTDAGIRPADIDLVIDFVTLPGEDSPYLSFAQKLS